MTVSNSRRFTKVNPCPVCGGYDKAMRGQSTRCFGFYSDDGAYANCTRGDYAVGLPMNAKSQTYGHRIVGQCNCGKSHGPNDGQPGPSTQPRRIVAEYNYQGEDGQLLFQVVRFEPKGFSQRRPGPDGDWIWNLQSVTRIPYRLPELLAADPSDWVFVPEGEKDCNRLSGYELVATTNSEGAGGWRGELVGYFRGRHVVVLSDNDDVGRKHSVEVAKSLTGVAASVRVLDLPGLENKGDISDWLDAGNSIEHLLLLVAGTPEWAPPDIGASDNEIQDHRYPMTDYGNAERMIAWHREDLRYIFPWGKWLVWAGTHWTTNTKGEVMRRAKSTAREMYRQASALAEQASGESDEDKRQAMASEAETLLKWARRSESEKLLNSMIKLGASQTGIPVEPQSLDCNPWLLNCANGTLDLRTGKLGSHARMDMLSKLAPVKYDPDAQCPVWLGFLDRVMGANGGLIGFLQRAIGYSLSGATSEHCIFVLYGRGRNGKSTFLETFLRMLGDYARKAPSELLMVKRGDSHPTDKAVLHGVRFTPATETEEGQAFAEAVLKELTSEDSISTRRMREDFWDFTPSHHIWLGTNHRPNVKGTDRAIWSRIWLIPFTVTIPQEDQDKKLLQKLKSEWSGILAWAVQGMLDWQEGGLREPPEVCRATNEYRDDMDVLGVFLAEHCTDEENARVSSSELYEAYQRWAKNSGESNMRKVGFGQALEERGYRKARGAKGVRLWRGLRLLAEDEAPPMQSDFFGEEQGDITDVSDAGSSIEFHGNETRALNRKNTPLTSPQARMPNVTSPVLDDCSSPDRPLDPWEMVDDDIGI